MENSNHSNTNKRATKWATNEKQHTMFHGFGNRCALGQSSQRTTNAVWQLPATLNATNALLTDPLRSGVLVFVGSLWKHHAQKPENVHAHGWDTSGINTYLFL